MNLRRVPGTSDYAVGENFSLFEMSSSNPYHVAWWYRRDFDLPRTGERVWLHLDGVNYRANVWINGKLAASDKQIAGAYRRFVLDVTALVQPGARNAIAVETFAPGKNDLAPSFIDWNPSPPDRNLGLWHDVYLTTSGPVPIASPFVVSKLPSLDEAWLTVAAELTNAGAAPVTGTVRATIAGRIMVAAAITPAPPETRALSLGPAHRRALIVHKPKLWW